MFCPKCGKINPDEEQVCSGCGAQLHSEESAAPEKKGNTAKIVFAVIAVLIVVCILVMVLNGCGTMETLPEKMTF